MEAILANNYDADFLSNRFTENMEYFKTKNYEIFEKFIDYSPGANKLGIDDFGQFNILCGQDWLYPDDIKETIGKQIAAFKEFKPSLSTLQFDIETPSDTINATQKGINKYFHEQLILNSPEYNDNMLSPIIISLGTGLGYHFGEILKNNPLKLVIYEPHDDFFYASLFICNYATLEQAFEKKSSENIVFLVGKNDTELLNYMVQISNSSQQHYLSKVMLFMHYTNDNLRIANEKLVAQYPFLITKGGFLEDSIIGLNHMDIKMETQTHFLKKNGSKKNFPVIIVASGPSIDKIINVISEHQDNFIIISCSSSIQICLKSGIIPDFHVESERGFSTYKNLSLLENISLLKQTTLLTNNVIHPDVPKLFKNTIFTLKPNELSTDIYYLTLFQKNSNIIRLAKSGPTSGNCALAFAVELGFENIILAGFDCAYPNKLYHHSKNSIYYTHNLQNTPTNDSFKVTGFDGSEMYSNYLLENSRIRIEEITMNNPSIHFYNFSYGAKIESTNHLNTETFKDLITERKLQKLNKKNIFNQIINTNCASISLNKGDQKTITKIKNNIINDFEISTNELIEFFSESKKTFSDFFYDFENIYEHARHLNQFQKHLINCTIYNMTICIATGLFKTDNSENIKKYMNKSYEIFGNYLLAGLNLLKKQQFTPENKIDYQSAIEHKY